MSKKPSTPKPKPPAHLSDDLKAIWKELQPTLGDDTPAAVIESLAVQVKTMRDARKSIDADGLVVRDAKDNAVEHPALQIERAAAKTIDQINKTWAL